jgi:hypothetical protein
MSLWENPRREVHLDFERIHFPGLQILGIGPRFALRAIEPGSGDERD